MHQNIEPLSRNDYENYHRINCAPVIKRMIRFIKDRTENYGVDPRITTLFDKFQIHILVSMNPDGAVARSRVNGNLYDLNRDFPDFSTNDNVDDLAGLK